MNYTVATVMHDMQDINKSSHLRSATCSCILISLSVTILRRLSVLLKTLQRTFSSHLYKVHVYWIRVPLIVILSTFVGFFKRQLQLESCGPIHIKNNDYGFHCNFTTTVWDVVAHWLNR